jgi:hypothetical protein
VVLVTEEGKNLSIKCKTINLYDLYFTFLTAYICLKILNSQVDKGKYNII